MQAASTSEPHAQPGTAERRTGARHMSIFRVARLVHAGHDQLCVVRNISPGGVMIEVNHVPPVGAKVRIELRSDKALDASVRWVRNREAGIAFDQMVDVAALLREERPSILRKPPRGPRFDRNGVAYILGGDEPIPGAITNVSINGVAVRSPVALPKGEPVVVKIEGLGPARAHVRWCADGEIGLRLETPLSYRALADWLDDQAENSVG
jgi:hypothetical protein